MRLSLDKINCGAGTQPRAKLDPEVVDDYAAAMADGVEFPPLEIVTDGSDNYLTDGFHRYFGARRAGKVDFEANVKPGELSDAIWASLAANARHGLRRGNEDKRRAVESALRLKPDMSDRALAAHCGVGHSLVAIVRAALHGPPQVTEKTPAVPPVPTAPPTRTGLDGKSYPMPVPKPPKAPPVPRDGIGRRVPAHLLELWNRKGEPEELLRQLAHVRATVTKLQEAGDQLYAEVNANSAVLDLGNAYASLKVAVPFAVCPYCNGVPGGCNTCGGRGLVSKHRWDTACAQEYKDKAIQEAKECN